MDFSHTELHRVMPARAATQAKLSLLADENTCSV